MVGERSVGKVLDALPPVLRIETKRFRLLVAGLEEEHAKSKFPSPRFERVHQEVGDAAATKVGSHPEAFDLARFKLRPTDRTKPHTTGEVPIRARDEVATEWGAELIKVCCHVVLDRSVAPVEFVSSGEYNAECSG